MIKSYGTTLMIHNEETLMELGEYLARLERRVDRLEVILHKVAPESDSLWDEEDDTIPEDEEQPAPQREALILTAFKEPGKAPVFRLLPNELKALQDAVGGYIEAVPVGAGLVAICNEEGRLHGMDYNCTVGSIDFVGPVVFAEEAGEEFASINKDAFRSAFGWMWEGKDHE